MSEIEKEPAIGISVNCGAIVFQTFLPQDADDKTINSMLDKLAKAGARQQAKVELETMRKNLKVNETQLTRMREDRARVEQTLSAQAEGRRGGQRNEADLKLKREQADVNEKRMIEILNEAKEEIRATEALIAGD